MSINSFDNKIDLDFQIPTQDYMRETHKLKIRNIKHVVGTGKILLAENGLMRRAKLIESNQFDKFLIGFSIAIHPTTANKATKMTIADQMILSYAFNSEMNTTFLLGSGNVFSTKSIFPNGIAGVNTLPDNFTSVTFGQNFSMLDYFHRIITDGASVDHLQMFGKTHDKVKLWLPVESGKDIWFHGYPIITGNIGYLSFGLIYAECDKVI